MATLPSVNSLTLEEFHLHWRLGCGLVSETSNLAVIHMPSGGGNTEVMRAVEESHRDAHPQRLPRRGDKLVAAPFSQNAFVGEISVFNNNEISVLVTEGRTPQTFRVPFTQVTWKPKKRCWVYWPKDVLRIARAVDDAVLPLLGHHPRFGEAFRVDGRVGFIKRLLGRPVALASDGMVMNSMRGCVVSLKGSEVDVLLEDMRYDGDARMWVGRSLEAES